MDVRESLLVWKDAKDLKMKVECAKLAPFRLTPWFSERPWGRLDLRPWYASTGTSEPVGEAWLTGPQCVVETGAMMGQTLTQVASERLLGAEFPILVKLLFPSDKLSVQVHPDDAMAQAMGYTRGKTECWYVLDAEPEATIALGLREGATVDRVQAAIVSGTLEDLLEWVPVVAGDMIFVDAGTVHAIGPGVVLLETQQTSDVTFRLYDYGRPRELHLEQGLRALRMRTAAGKVQPRAMDGFTRLIEQRYFVVDRYDLETGGEATESVAGAGCLVGLSGSAQVASEGSEVVELRAGQAVVLPADCGRVSVHAEVATSFVRCFVPNYFVAGSNE
jgi:mannose-6-phosphate isomerase